MKQETMMKFSVDKSLNQILVERKYQAPLEKVWDAWTRSDILDKWWAPNPYKAVTKNLDFRIGGKWIYAMEGPNGEKHWSFAEFLDIKKNEFLSLKDGFSDENGVLNTSMPASNWNIQFKEEDAMTVVNILLLFKNKEDLDNILDMGFEEGFTEGLGNLEGYLKSSAKK